METKGGSCRVCSDRFCIDLDEELVKRRILDTNSRVIGNAHTTIEDCPTRIDEEVSRVTTEVLTAYENHNDDEARALLADYHRRVALRKQP